MTSLSIKVTVFALLMIGASCATKKITNTACWVNPETSKNKYKNIYVLGMLKTGYNNIAVENEMATMAAQRGITTTRNYDVQPATEISMEMRKDLAIMKIKEYACDAICTIGVKDIHAESRYVGGSSLHVSGYMPYNNYGGYYNQFPTYYSNYYAPGTGINMNSYQSGSVQLSPGRVETEKTYFVECNLFDAANYELLFSIQSEAVNPTDIEKASKEYCTAIFKTLEEKGLVRPIAKAGK